MVSVTPSMFPGSQVVLPVIVSATFSQVVTVLVGHHSQHRPISMVNYVLDRILLRQSKLVRFEFSTECEFFKQVDGQISKDKISVLRRDP